MGKIGRATRHLTIVACMAGLAACSAQYRTHGYLPPEEDLQQIVPGVDTRATVEDLVGVPTTSGILNESGFYYVESEVRTFAWQRPSVVDRRVLAINFDDAGVVTNISEYGLEDGRVVPLTRRVTETPDSDIGFIRRLFGNIGGVSLGGLVDG